MNTSIILLSALCVSPVPLDKGVISSHFGWRVFPGESEHSLHVGVDIVAPKGTPITSMTSGTVVFADLDSEGGGLMVSVKSYHRGKLKLVRYMHLSKILVKKGDYVDHKTVLGRLGSTGRSTGPHLHIEMAVIRDGLKPRYDDPIKYLCAYKKDLHLPHKKMKYKFTLKEDKPIFLRDLDVNNLKSKSNIIK
jgi:murein DD-endopeptidase MepM/ murein hydrolase activator NlpD